MFAHSQRRISILNVSTGVIECLHASIVFVIQQKLVYNEN